MPKCQVNNNVNNVQCTSVYISFKTLLYYSFFKPHKTQKLLIIILKILPVIKKNPLIDVNSFLVMTSQVVNRCQAQLFKCKELIHSWIQKLLKNSNQPI